MSSYTNTNNLTKQQKKLEVKWTRILKNWGHDNDALDDLYEQGDAIHGKGFRAFLHSITVHKDINNVTTQDSGLGGRFDVLQDEISSGPSKPPSFADIMREQASEC